MNVIPFQPRRVQVENFAQSRPRLRPAKRPRPVKKTPKTA